MNRRHALACAAILVVVAGCRQDPTRTSVAAPPASSRAGVAAANPLAVEAGLEVLRRGGSAVDAAVAVQAMLGLVEPQSSGVGGGAFMVFLDGRTGHVTAYEGRETAPAGARPDMFIGDDGKPLSYSDAVTSGRSTGAPGAIAMLGLAHSEHGRLPWNTLFSAAIAAADGGFAVPKRLARFANGDSTQATLPDARALFAAPDGGIVQAGDTLRSPAYARTLGIIADRGPRALLEGDLAAKIALFLEAIAQRGRELRDAIGEQGHAADLADVPSPAMLEGR